MGDALLNQALENGGNDRFAMRRIAAAIAGLLIATPAVFAGETWVMASWESKGPPKPETLAEEYGWYGNGYYIDLQSVVRKGDLVFYNDGFSGLDRNKRPIQVFWDEQGRRPIRTRLRIANCKTSDWKERETSDFKQPDVAYRPVIQLACK